MKELSIEEKAKAYDEALKVAKGLYAKDAPDSLHLERMFPELAESEDDRIRKEIKDFFSRIMLGQENFLKEDYDWNTWLAWLEKQSKDSPVLSNSTNTGKVEQKPAWSEEDKNAIQVLKDIVKHSNEIDENIYTIPLKEKLYNWLKSLKERCVWKPSEEMLEALHKAIPENVMEISEDEMLLDKLYQGLKYGRVLSKN